MLLGEEAREREAGYSVVAVAEEAMEIVLVG